MFIIILGEARGSTDGCPPVGGLQCKCKRNGSYAIKGLGSWALGTVEFPGIAADVDIMGYWRVLCCMS